MTIQQALLSAIKKLQKTKSTSPHLDAEVLLSYVMRKPKVYLLSNQNKKVTAAQLIKFRSLVARRQNDVPLAYLTGQKEFYGLNFSVNRHVLIPRPETELLVEEAIKHARQVQRATSHEPCAICDLGTGSGCIAITLAKYLPGIKIIATDISKKALFMAKKNAQRHKVAKKIKFIKGDLLWPWLASSQRAAKKMGRSRAPARLPLFDLIVANLPYLTKDELTNVQREPKKALYGGKMGVELIEQLLIQSTKVLKHNGTILLEISPTQTKVVDYIVEQQLPGKKVTFIKDFSGRDRVARIE